MALTASCDRTASVIEIESGGTIVTVSPRAPGTAAAAIAAATSSAACRRRPIDRQLNVKSTVTSTCCPASTATIEGRMRDVNTL